MFGKKQPGHVLITAGGFYGLVVAAGLAILRFGKISDPNFFAEFLGNTTLFITFIIPFLLSLWVLRSESPTLQSGVWLGAGILALLESLFVFYFSGITLLLLPAAILLLLGAMLHFRAVGPLPAWPVLLGALGLVLVGRLALALLYSLPDPHCWVLVSGEQGQFWEERPYSTSMSFGPNDVQSTCTSDIISPMEAALSLGVWVVGGILLALFNRVTGAGKSASTSEG